MESMRILFMSQIRQSNDTCQIAPTPMLDPNCISKQVSDITNHCFSIWQRAAHLWAPCIYLLLVIPFHLILLWHSKKRGLGSMTLVKVFTAIMLSLLTLIQLAYKQENFAVSVTNFSNEFMSKITLVVTFTIVAAVTILERRRGSDGKYLPLLAFWTLMLASASFTLYSYSKIHFHIGNNIDLFMNIAHFLGVFLLFFMSLLSEKSPSKTDGQTTKSFHPEDGASWWENLTMSWTSCLVWTGFSKNLEKTDVPDLAPTDKCRYVCPHLERIWKQEEFRYKLTNEIQTIRKHSDRFGIQQNGDFNGSLLDHSKISNSVRIEKDEIEKVSLFKALLKIYGIRFFIMQFIKAALRMCDFINPVLTAALINHIQNRRNESKWNGIIIVISMFILTCLTELGHKRIWYSILRLSRHMQTSVAMLIFKKSLSLKSECQKDKTNGEIVNLISDDCSRVFHMSNFIYCIIMTPLKVGMALYLLYSYLGWSMLVGFVIMLLLIPFNTFVSRGTKDTHLKRNEVKDKRVKLMNEIINGIKVLKLYAWERSFIRKVKDIRSEEMDYCKKLSVYRACIDSMFRAIPFFVKVGAFGTFLLLGGHLDATKGFLTISLFHTLNQPLSTMAILIPDYMAAIVSLRRITKFLNGEDISSDFVKKVTRGTSAISVKEGTFSWERSSPDPTLTNVNVEIPKGGLVAVVGMVGSGKSSLLSSILGEMEKLYGEVEIKGRLAYVPQEAWILNATLQDNVLFGSKMDKQWYRQVIDGCSLKNDINVLAAGDRTEIGEKGINLSGGQKQRVSLARAVYNDADVYLLDDPLSAVDAHVGKHIFNKVVSHQGILKDKTRVLVTHGIHWLPFVDSIIVMKDGQISETGTYQHLLSRDGAFAQFLRDLYSQTSDKKLKHKICKRLNSIEGQEQERSFKTLEETKKFTNEASGNSEDSSDDENDNDDVGNHKNISDSVGKLIDEEELELGSVKKGIYLDYLRAIGVKYVSFFIFIYLIKIVADNCNTYVVKLWTDDLLLANKSLSQTKEYMDRSSYYFYSFFISGLIDIVAAFLFIALTYQGGYNAANRIHNNLLCTILKCPMSFFDTTPAARVVNRFSTDIARVDGLGGCLRDCTESFFRFSTSLILMVVNVPVILVCIVPISGLYYCLHRIHISTIRQLRRYRTKHRSPMNVHFSETLTGAASIRAYNCQTRFTQTMETKIEQWFKFVNMEAAVTVWFAMRMTFLYLFIQMVTGMVIVMNTNMTAGMAGLVLMYAGELSRNLGALVQMMTNMEMEVVSLERVFDYTKKPIEAPWEISETKPAADWPQNGHIVFNDFKARYRDGLDLVLKGVNCDIKNGEKIGIVGRTGAGKSSLTMALFRLVEAASGHIHVDNEKTADLGLHDLRGKITILPQEPVIFAGTLRMNLDPFDKFTTKELWTALQYTHLKTFVEGLPNQLDFECEEGGKNISVGQRQLLCLARTLLRQTKILVLDEATAAVDMETDELIQKTIRASFQQCTVLSIAHRLNTIMDYDRILVLDQGVVKEFDSPNNLLANKHSTFYGMAKDAKLV